MSDKIKYIFLTIGIAAIIVMCLTFDVSFAELYRDMQRTGIRLVAILALGRTVCDEYDVMARHHPWLRRLSCVVLPAVEAHCHRLCPELFDACRAAWRRAVQDSCHDTAYRRAEGNIVCGAVFHDACVLAFPVLAHLVGALCRHRACHSSLSDSVFHHSSHGIVLPCRDIFLHERLSYRYGDKDSAHPRQTAFPWQTCREILLCT